VGAIGLEPMDSNEGGFTVRCNCRYATLPKTGKEKMVQWTTPFMIGITNDGLNSDTVGQCFLSATNRLTCIIPQSTYKCSSAFYSHLRGIVSYLTRLTDVWVLKFTFYLCKDIDFLLEFQTNSNNF
jgi:hypothetical protein